MSTSLAGSTWARHVTQ